ncbi:hypothetical protein ACEQPO_24690 [Bacillus sp. SL00103]
MVNHKESISSYQAKCHYCKYNTRRSMMILTFNGSGAATHLTAGLHSYS